MVTDPADQWFKHQESEAAEAARQREADMNYPNTPGYKVPGPSQIAADEEREKAPPLRERVYQLLQLRGPMTTDECAIRLNKSILAIRPRFSELLAQGKIADTGRVSRNESGKRATIWQAVEHFQQTPLL